jgi:endo-1,4-beta-xylanase
MPRLLPRDHHNLYKSDLASKMFAFTKLVAVISAVTGALAAPAAEPSLDSPDFELGGQNLARRQNYNQNYVTSGSVNFSPASNGYSVTFSGAGDFVVGKGWSTGTTR